MKAFFHHGAHGIVLLLVAVLLAAAGCGQSSEARRLATQADGAELGPTIGSIADVVTPMPIPVEGFGLVGNLAGTGSATCPPQVRAYLKRYILSQLPNEALNLEELINSNTTAVVLLEGTIPAIASKGDHFDVRVSLMPGSETTSLRGGWLYKAELRPQGPGGSASRPLGTVEGPVFVNMVEVAKPDVTTAYVLGGGRTLDDYSGIITLQKPDYVLAGAIRDRLSGRYGFDLARAMSPRVIEYALPPDYQRRKMQFVALVAATYMNETPQLTRTRTDRFVQQLAAGQDEERSEIALEAIGRECLGQLASLLNSPDEEVRFRAARCMLNLRDDSALGTLRQIALDPKSAYRLEALEAVAASARRNDAAALARLLLRDDDSRMVLAAYEYLRELGNLAVTQDFIGRSFYLEHVVATDRKGIFVARRGDPRIVVFGAPLICRDSMFVESPDGMVMIDAQPGRGYMSLMRKNPMRPGTIGPLKSGFVLSEVIRTLGSEFAQTEEGHVTALGVSYAEVIALLEQMCAKGAVAAEFWPGPLPKFDLTVKK